MAVKLWTSWNQNIKKKNAAILTNSKTPFGYCYGVKKKKKKKLLKEHLRHLQQWTMNINVKIKEKND